MSDFNKQVIEQFRSNQGKVGGYFEGKNMIILTTIGAKSGEARTTPLVYTEDAGKPVIIASKGGADTNPDWYYNILKNPVVTVEIGTERFEARAVVAEEAERVRLYTQMETELAGFKDYRLKTSRKIPVIVLERFS